MTSPDINISMMQAISRLPRVDVLPVQSMLYGEYSPVDARFGITPANILFALHRAREAQKLAVSWRSFNVGAAVLAFKYKPACVAILSGINIKPEEETVLNVHAEQLALQKVEDHQLDRISAVVVVGNVQADTQSGKLANTLHPCGLCRDKLADSPAVDSEQTLIVSAVPTFKTIELYSLAALERFHKSGKPNEIVTLRFAEELELFTPFEPNNTTKPHRLIDDEKSDHEERVWNDAIGPPLSKLRLTGQLFPES